MNEIHHHRITIDLWIWEPQKQKVNEEIDVLLGKLKAKELLGTAGYVRTHLGEVEGE